MLHVNFEHWLPSEKSDSKKILNLGFLVLSEIITIISSQNFVRTRRCDGFEVFREKFLFAKRLTSFPHLRFMLQSKFRIQLFTSSQTSSGKQGKVREINEVPNLWNWFLDSKHTLKWQSNILKDRWAFQQHVGTLFVFIKFAFRQLCAI